MAALAPVSSFSVSKINIPLHTSFAISKGALEEAANVLVTFSDVNGVTGIGEAAPFYVLTHDAQPEVEVACRELCTRLRGKSVRAALEEVHNELKIEFSKTPSALTGVEMALYDLRARQLGVPLAQLFGNASQTIAETDITLPIMPAADTMAFWERFSSYDFKNVKVKVGGGKVSDDVARIVELKRILPKDVVLTLDGNQGCTVQSALEMLKELERAQIVPLFFEQPLPEDDWAGMAKLTATCPIPICADETVKTAAQAIRVVNDKAAHMINLKFTKAGIKETLDIITVAKAAGLRLMIGGMVETEIAMTASLHAVCGTGAIEWCDLDTPFFLSKHPCVESPYHARKARLALPKGPGLGLELGNL